MNNWKEENNALHKTYVFKNFVEALSWMIKAAFVVEKFNHHPEWSNIYNRVFVKLTTHDAGNTVTNKDRKLAELLDAV